MAFRKELILNIPFDLLQKLENKKTIEGLIPNICNLKLGDHIEYETESERTFYNGFVKVLSVGESSGDSQECTFGKI